MFRGVPLMVAVSALGSGLAVMPAQASETRVFNFALACDGTNKTLDVAVSGLGLNATRFIQGGEVIVTGGGPPRYIFLRVAEDPLKQIVGLGPGETGARIALPGFIVAQAGAGGVVHLSIDGACSPTLDRSGHAGSQEIQGTATVYFF